QDAVLWDRDPTVADQNFQHPAAFRPGCRISGSYRMTVPLVAATLALRALQAAIPGMERVMFASALGACFEPVKADRASNAKRRQCAHRISRPSPPTSITGGRNV